MGSHLEGCPAFPSLGWLFKCSGKEGMLLRVCSLYMCILIVVFQEADKKEKDKGLVTLNEAGVLGEIQRLGSGLVKSVAVKRS